MMELHLIRPEWLWTLVPAIILTALLWRQRKRNGGWQSVIAPDLLRHLIDDSTASRGRNLLPIILLGWLLAALAASGPSWQKIPQPVHQRQDALVILLDLSYSMKSADLVPSRLERARQKILDLLQERREGQTALIAFAGDAHVVTPLTDDTPTIANLLPALDPDMMPLPGSEPVSAVTQALELLRSSGISRGRILLVTDGVSARDSEGIQQVLAGSPVRLTVMGVGTPTGAPIPLPNGGFVKDETGGIVMPGLDEGALRQLAGAVGGDYRRLQVDDSDLQALVAATPLDGREETLALDRSADTWEDQGFLLVLALLPLALALFRRGWLLAALPMLLILQPEPVHADAWDDLWLTPDQQGQRALERGDAEAAASLFESPAWAGTAAYQGGDYETAVERFSATETADSLYNRGNALARAGKLDEAIAAYEQSLELLPEQEDARENLELLKKLKQEQQEQDQQQQQNQQQEDQQQQDQQQQDQQQQDQQQQDAKQQQQQEQQQQQQQQQGQQQDQNQQQGQEQQQGQDPTQRQEPQQGQEQQQERSGEEAASDESAREATEQEAAEHSGGPPPQGGDEGTEAEGPASETDPGEEERNQAMEQWLRRVPDDPSGLLREKFRYESRQRQEQGLGRDDETYW